MGKIAGFPFLPAGCFSFAEIMVEKNSISWPVGSSPSFFKGVIL